MAARTAKPMLATTRKTRTDTKSLPKKIEPLGASSVAAAPSKKRATAANTSKPRDKKVAAGRVEKKKAAPAKKATVTKKAPATKAKAGVKKVEGKGKVKAAAKAAAPKKATTTKKAPGRPKKA